MGNSFKESISDRITQFKWNVSSNAVKKFCKDSARNILAILFQQQIRILSGSFSIKCKSWNVIFEVMIIRFIEIFNTNREDYIIFLDIGGLLVQLPYKYQKTCAILGYLKYWITSCTICYQRNTWASSTVYWQVPDITTWAYHKAHIYVLFYVKDNWKNNARSDYLQMMVNSKLSVKIAWKQNFKNINKKKTIYIWPTNGKMWTGIRIHRISRRMKR